MFFANKPTSENPPQTQSSTTAVFFMGLLMGIHLEAILPYYSGRGVSSDGAPAARKKNTIGSTVSPIATGSRIDARHLRIFTSSISGRHHAKRDLRRPVVRSFPANRINPRGRKIPAAQLIRLNDSVPPEGEALEAFVVLGPLPMTKLHSYG